MRPLVFLLVATGLAHAVPVDTSQPPRDWIKQGAKACPATGRLDGGPPPSRRAVCKDAQFVENGPAATWWDDKGTLQSLGAYTDGKMSGRWTYWRPDGKIAREGSYRNGLKHGPWVAYHANGAVFLKESFDDDGREDGVHIALAPDGKELRRWTMTHGTGTMLTWNEDGTLNGEYAYKDGEPHGKFTSWHPNGKVQTTGAFVDGKADGVWLTYDEKGVLRSKGAYLLGGQVGDWSAFDDKGAQTLLTRREATGCTTIAEILYQDGAPLATVTTTACDTKESLERAAFGDKKAKDHVCLERMRHFPGVAVAGGFAYDRGCAQTTWLLDCKPQAAAPDSKTVLARAGWAKAKGPARQILALAYVDEVVLRWSGSITDSPDKRSSVARADGGVVVTAWTSPPSGMRPTRTITLMEWTFTPDGAVTSRSLKTSSR
jgi:antitoxin component YwqK of YwqJK toxin-antitoxin module